MKLFNFINDNTDLIDYKKDIILRQKYLSLNTDSLRKKFIKFITNRMFNHSLKRRGFEHDENLVKVCRICNGRLETPDGELKHVIDNHFSYLSKSD